MWMPLILFSSCSLSSSPDATACRSAICSSFLVPLVHSVHLPFLLYKWELPHCTWRVEQVSSDTSEVYPYCFPDCAAAFLAGKRDVTVLLARSDRLSAHQAHVLRSGAFGLAPPGLACGRAAWSPSSVPANSARPGSNPVSLNITKHFSTVAYLAFCTKSRVSFSFWDSQSRSSLQPPTIKSSPPNTHGQLLQLSGPVSAPTFCTRCCQRRCCGECAVHAFLRRQHRSASCRCGGFTYVSVRASACRDAPLASTSMSCYQFPVFVFVVY